MDWKERITLDPEILVGKPTIKGTRISVELVIDLLANGAAYEEIIQSYPHLTRDDILACLHYAGATLSEWKFYPVRLPE